MPLPKLPPPPSWVDFSPESKRGLDLLGLRLPAQAISYWLLDGITTISPMLRYLSLRAWLVDSYRSAASGLPDDIDVFRAFARQGERVFALGNVAVDLDVFGIVGVSKARELIEESGGTIPLDQLVEQSAMAAYAGPAEDLRLVFSRDDGAPGITEERGLPLARAVDASFSSTGLGRRIRNGETFEEASRAALEEFGEVAGIQRFLPEEREILLDVILPADPLADETARLGTYGLLLTLAERLERKPSEEDLFTCAREVEDRVHESLIPSRDGWLLYHVRDLLAVVHEAVLEQIVELVGAGAGDRSRADDVVAAILNDWDLITQLFADIGLDSSGSVEPGMPFPDFCGVVSEVCSEGSSESRGFRRWEGGPNEAKLIAASRRYGAAGAALLPLAWLLARHRTQPGVADGTDGFELLSSRGRNRFGLKQIVFPVLDRFEADDVDLATAISELVRLTVEQHAQIALARLAQDTNRDVSVLIIDEDSWIRARPFSAGRTASRIPQAIGWLDQLDLVHEEGLTPRGAEVLGRITGTLSRGASA